MSDSVKKVILKKGAKLVKNMDRGHFSPLALQKRTLKQLLRQAGNTDFGRHYDFPKINGSIDPLNSFREIVPIHDYDKIFHEWWHRSLKGEKNIAWRGAVKYFGLSSGTTGAASKYIPITSDMTRAMRQTAFRLFACLPKYGLPASFYLKNWFMIGGSASLRPEGNCFVGDLSGINAKSPPIWVRPYFKPGIQIAHYKDWDERIHAIALNAPKWNIGIVTGIPSWVQLSFEYIIKYHKLDTIHDIWPNLSVFVTGGTAFAPYKKSFEKLLAKPLIYQDSYLASEGFIAYQARPDTHAMKMALNNGIFFEFVPFNSDNFDGEGNIKKEAEALHIGEVKEGLDYALLLSTCAGAWRYLIGDTIRFTDLERKEIIITGRTKHFLSICGEHLSIDNMNQALKRTEEILDISVGEFTVSGVKSGSHFAHKWYLGCNTDVDTKKIAEVLDEQLMLVNDDYRAERNAMLQDLQLQVIPNEIFINWQRSIGKLNGQSKIPRVLKPNLFPDWEAFVKKEMASF
jgi:hypothetical protein